MNKIKQTLNNYVCSQSTLKEKIDAKKSRSYFPKRLLKPAIAFLLIVMTFVGGNSYYHVAASYVSLDINPSVILTANNFDRVIKVKYLNNEGKILLESLYLYNKDISEAVNLVVKEAEKLGYINSDTEEDLLVVTTYCNNETKRMALRKRIQANLEVSNSENVIESTIIDQGATTKVIDDDNFGNIGPGKVTLIQEAIKENPDLNQEELEQMPMHEIVEMLGEEPGCNGYGKCGR